MKDALGSYFNLTLLFFFILLVSGFIALSVNYTKAYRVKNNVLTLIEKYEGHAEAKDLLDRSMQYNKSIGYVIPDNAIRSAEAKGYTCPRQGADNLGWCYKNGEKVNDEFTTVDIVVFININVPVINQIFSNFDFFWMTGRTNTIPIL